MTDFNVQIGIGGMGLFVPRVPGRRFADGCYYLAAGDSPRWATIEAGSARPDWIMSHRCALAFLDDAIVTASGGAAVQTNPNGTKMWFVDGLDLDVSGAIGGWTPPTAADLAGLLDLEPYVGGRVRPDLVGPAYPSTSRLNARLQLSVGRLRSRRTEDDDTIPHGPVIDLWDPTRYLHRDGPVLRDFQLADLVEWSFRVRDVLVIRGRKGDSIQEVRSRPRGDGPLRILLHNQEDEHHRLIGDDGYQLSEEHPHSPGAPVEQGLRHTELVYRLLDDATVHVPYRRSTVTPAGWHGFRSSSSEFCPPFSNGGP